MADADLKIIPPVIAHRGASAYAPENTFAAFKKAKELGAQWIEFDVMLNADEEVVIIHDEMLDRTTNGSGDVSQLTNEGLNQLDAGSWFGVEFKDEKIPTLKQLMCFLKEVPLACNIEIKAQAGKEKDVVKRVLDLVQEFWPANIEPPLFSSFSMTVLREIRAYSSTCRLGCLMDTHDDLLYVELDNELNFASFNLNAGILSEDIIAGLKTLEKPLLAYTVNDPEHAQKLFSFGVDAVFTDCPDKILDTL